MMIRLAVVLVLLSSRFASADTGEDAKSPEVALALSGGATAVSIAAVVGGFVVSDRGGPNRDFWSGVAIAGAMSTLITPTFGEWYAGRIFTGGLGLRLAGVAVMGLGVTQLSICFDECSGTSNNGAAVTLITLGLISYGAGIVSDIAAAPSTARQANAHRHAAITPTVMRSSSGRSAYGLGLGGSF